MSSYLEHQQSVLGAIFLESACLDTVSQIVNVNDFDELHGTLYQSCLDVVAKGGIPDIVTIMKFDLCDPQYLAKLIDFVPTVANVGFYAKAVADFGQRRKLAEIMHSGIEQLKGGENPKAWIEEQLSYLHRGVQEEKHIKAVLQDTWKDIEEIAKNGVSQGFEVGIEDLDKRGIFQKGDLIIIAGRPGMGKSVLGAQILSNKVASLIYTFEMSSTQLCKRLFAAKGKVNLEKIRSAKFNDSDYHKLNQATEDLAQKNMWFVEASKLSIQDMRAKTRLMVKKHKIEIVVVDYIQLCYDPTKSNNREQEVSSITRNLKQMAQELNICVVALAQLNRKLEERADKRPMMADLRESGAIEQDADVIIFAYRDYVYNKNAPERDSELIIAKFRNGEPGYVPCLFIGEHQIFVSEYKG